MVRPSLHTRIYRKIPIISSGAHFWSKGLFAKFFLGGGGGGLYSGGLYRDEYLRFENTFFCSTNCNFLKLSAHNLFLLLIFLPIIPNITPGGLFSGGRGLYMEGVFRFKSWFQNAHGLIRGGTYRNFTAGIYIYRERERDGRTT